MEPEDIVDPTHHKVQLSVALTTLVASFNDTAEGNPAENLLLRAMTAIVEEMEAESRKAVCAASPLRVVQ
jgi:hypothetical protein